MNQITAAKLIELFQKQAKAHNLSLDKLTVDFRFNHRNDWVTNMEELSFDYYGGSLTIDLEPEDSEDWLPDDEY